MLKDVAFLSNNIFFSTQTETHLPWIMRHLFSVPECWFAVRLHKRHELLLHGCTAVLPSHGPRQQSCACLGDVCQVHFCSASPPARPAALLCCFWKALDCKQMKINPCLPCMLACLLSSVLGFICRFPVRFLESWLVTPLDFQCHPNLNFNESGVFSSLAYLCLLVFGWWLLLQRQKF